MKCLKCGFDLMDKSQSNENWKVFHAKCQKCGKKMEAQQMVESMMGKKGKK